jgi:hypothetical protein
MLARIYACPFYMSRRFTLTLSILTSVSMHRDVILEANYRSVNRRIHYTDGWHVHHSSTNVRSSGHDSILLSNAKNVKDAWQDLAARQRCLGFGKSKEMKLRVVDGRQVPHRSSFAMFEAPVHWMSQFSTCSAPSIFLHNRKEATEPLTEH